MFKKALATANAAALMGLVTVTSKAQVVFPDTGLSGEDLSNATVTETTSYAGPAILGGLALFALGLGIYWIRKQIKKGSSAGG